MKRLKRFKEWRPTWKAFWWAAASAYLLTCSTVPVFFNILLYGVASATWFDWMMVASVAVLYIIVIGLFAWLVYKPIGASGGPHPFTLALFWLTAIVVVGISSLAWYVLDLFGFWSAFGNLYRSLGIWWIPFIYFATWIVARIIGKLPPFGLFKRPMVRSGVSCGMILSYLLLTILGSFAH